MTRVARREWLALGAILIGAAALRLLAIDSQALWTDEALTGPIALNPPWSLAFEPLDPTGPVYYWLYRLFVPEGASAWQARLPSVLAGVATVGMVFAIGRRIAGSGTGLLAAALTALSAPLIDYSQEARAYALCLAFIAGSAWALAALFEASSDHRRRLRLLAFASLTLLAMFTHLVGFFWALPAMFLIAAASRQSGHGHVSRREAAITLASILAIGSIEVLRVLRYSAEANAFTWLKQPTIGEFAGLLAVQWLPLTSLDISLALIGVASVLALLWAVRRAIRDFARSRPMAVGLIAALLLEPMAVWLFGYLHSPIAMPRTILPGVLGFALLIALALSFLGPGSRPATAVFAILLYAADLMATGTVRPKEDWRGAMAAFTPSVLTIVCPEWKGPAWLAVSKEGPVALASPKMPLLVRRTGERQGWDRLYFDRIQGPFQRLRAGGEIGKLIETTDVREIDFVASECPDEARRATMRWFGPGRVEVSFQSDGEGEVRVERWTAPGSRPRPVMILN